MTPVTGGHAQLMKALYTEGCRRERAGKGQGRQPGSQAEQEEKQVKGRGVPEGNALSHAEKEARIDHHQNRKQGSDVPIARPNTVALLQGASFPFRIVLTHHLPSSLRVKMNF